TIYTSLCLFSLNVPATTDISTLSLHDALPIFIDRVREAGYQPHVTRGTTRTIVAAVGSGRRHEIEALRVAPGVEDVVQIAQPTENGRAHVRTPVTVKSRMPSSA